MSKNCKLSQPSFTHNMTLPRKLDKCHVSAIDIVSSMSFDSCAKVLEYLASKMSALRL
jgi:hypothetical protein